MIVRERNFLEIKHYQHDFEISPNYGYGFSCDEEGNLLNEALKDRFNFYMENGVDLQGKPLKYKGIQSWTQTVWENAVLECQCGERVELDGDSECECGRWYNQWGQRLSDPSQWYE